MTTLQDAWKALQGIDPRSGVAGALLLALILAGGKYILLPLLRWLFEKLGKLLYPVLSGAFLLDRFWSLPKYSNALRERVSEITNPWLTKGQRLTDIFVPVSAKAGDRPDERVELGALFRQFPRIVLKGDPGSGKSTGLKAIALRCLRRELISESGRTFIPIFISLRQLSMDNLTLDAFVLKQFADLQFPHASRTVRRLIRQRRLVFLLDGLDEVDEGQRPGVIEQIRALIQSHRERKTICHLLLTSRPVGYDGQLDGIVDRTVEMAEFTPSDIRQFVRNWEFEPPKSHDDLLNCILPRPPILLISQNPLMLTIITYLYGHTQYELPKSREEFYKTCLEALLRAWDAAKNIGERNKIPAALKAAFLKRFAFQSLQQSRLDFDAPYLLDEIEIFRAEKKITDGTASDFLAELRRSGLLASLPTGEIFFAHKTLAESLATSHLRGKIEQLSTLWQTKPTAWLEVCSLYVADPDTTDDDIARLIDDAWRASDWSGAITLAGEAHTCPETQYRVITRTVASDPAIWPRLDQRALNALATLGEESRAILPTMLRVGSDEVRARTLRALGLIREAWATQLLVAAISDPVTQGPATNALISFGLDAIPILRAVFASDSCDLATAVAGIAVLNAIGGTEALEAMLPLLYKAEAGVATQAAIAAATLLRDPKLRDEFEARPQEWIGRNFISPNWEFLSQVKVVEAKHANADFVPWLALQHADHQRIYFLIIVCIYGRISQCDAFDLYEINDVAARLLIPSIILLRKIDEKAKLSVARLATNKDPQPDVDATRLEKLIAVEDALHNVRSDPLSLWSRMGAGSKPDIALNRVTAAVTGAVIGFACVAPLAAAIVSGKMPWWFGLPFLVVFGIPLFFAIVAKDKDIAPIAFMFIGFPITCFRAMVRLTRAGDLWDWAVIALIVVSGVAMLAFDIYAIASVDPRWLPLLIPFALGVLWRFEIGFKRLILVRRQNPLRILLDKLESAEVSTGLSRVPDTSKSPHISLVSGHR
jgi:NACHT domain